MKRLLVVSNAVKPGDGGPAAQSGCSVEGQASYPPSPVSLTPVPSKSMRHGQSGHGWQGARSAATTMPNPDDPHWAGRAPVPATLAPGSPGQPPSAGGPNPTLVANAGAASAAPAVGSGPPQSPVQPAGASSAPAAPAALAAMPPIENQVPTPLAAPSTMPAPAAIPTPGPSMTGLAPASDPRTVSRNGTDWQV